MKMTNLEPKQKEKGSALQAAKSIWALMDNERRNLLFALLAILTVSGINVSAPLLFGYTVDHFIAEKNFDGVLKVAAALFVLFAIGFGTGYVQMKLMGSIGQRMLFKLRNTIFEKLQSLPISYFNRNKAGDLISRINNDTEKLSQLFSETIMRFTGSIFILIGTAVFILVINWKLGLIALAPAIVTLLFTQLISGWIKAKSKASLAATGAMSGSLQESLDNFKVIVAFDRRDYFRMRFAQVNENNFKASLNAGLANGIFSPVYDLASNIAQLSVIGVAISFIIAGNLTIGALLSFLIYLDRFYQPLRQIAQLWSSLQIALAGWDRVSAILEEVNDLEVKASQEKANEAFVLEFKDVMFRYPDSEDGTKGKEVLHKESFQLAPGKTYALVGPTGGGKTTTASLMARLYDPTEGHVFINGKDIRTYEPAERAKRIGFILQEPFLFTGSLLDNIFYGNDLYENKTTEEKIAALKASSLQNLLMRFDGGLEAQINGSGDGMSLGQKQLIAFMRAVLREPDLLILDEATANIDTVTEQLLETTLQALPKKTTRVIIAHRLNTIENADEIFFVNGGKITPAGSFDEAVKLLMSGKRES
ncbi:MAG: ABC transporter ATP-binding protein [Candidatus Magasanikbacteria bacterium]|nr:ABC transporter ATP-binding protein [Candidatus Magasanikbacteria bacterium]MCA9391180.1 ABC transporter ATP-binding protein [Candidatus Magasanikbacteria bacterium]